MDEKRIDELEKYSQTHPGVDVTPLLAEDLQKPVNPWSVYLISLLFPPFGLYYTIKYLWVDREDAAKRRLGWIALILTLTIVGLGYLSLKYLAGWFTANNQNPTDVLRQYRDLLQ